ncbi:MAG TPA: hypothetical protein VES88_00235 [Gemmatimonadaceae bacterium]|nr:hypothetical protein [Gemmatimonadaceae bacterium]
MTRIFSFRASALSLAFFFGSWSPARAQQPPATSNRTSLFSSETSDIAGSAILSPDGRWVAFSIMSSPATARLAVSRVGIGEAQHLTAAGRWDSNPEWSPSRRAIYFVSNRPAQAGDQNYYGMVLTFDPRRGRAIGEPRQITTDAVNGFIRVSPDGKTLAYVDGRDRRLLKVIPAAGGAARVIARMPVRSGNIAWSRDGKSLLFVTNVPDQSDRVLHRVSAGGGEAVVVSRGLPLGRLTVGPGAESFLAEENGDGPRDRTLKLVDQRGTVLKTVATNRNTRGTQVTADGRSIVAIEANVVAPTRIMPIEGGTYRDVTAPVTYDWVMRWSGDGSTLYTWTEQKGAAVLAAVPVGGGAPRTFPESKKWSAQGANSRYLFEATRREGTKPRALAAIDLGNGTRHTISESLPGHNMIFPYGPGGTWAVHDELYFFERHGDRLDVKAWRGPGDVRTLRSLPASLIGRTNVAVHSERVVWLQERGDTLDLMIAAGSDGQPRRLLTMPTMPGSNEISFSNDGQQLVLHYSRGPGSPDLMAFVDPSGAAPPRIVDTGLSYWYWPRWLPDNSGVLVVGGGAGAEAHIVRIPVAEGAKPVNITRGDPASKWGFEVSPDGRFIAYPGEISKGTSVWRIDLGGGMR